MISVEVKGRHYNIATSWNELTREQLLDVIDTVYIKQYSAEQILLKLMKILLKLNYYRFLKIKAEDIDDKLYLVSFLFDQSIGLTNQLLPVERNLFGPSDEIGNMLMGEFVFSEHFFMQWDQDKGATELLDQFVATIYRPAKKKYFGLVAYDFKKNPDGDPRVQFNENVCAWYGREIVKGWPLNIKLAIATWYAGCRQKLVVDNSDVFGGSGEPAKYGLISIMRSVAKDSTYGDFDKIEKLPVGTLMMELNETVEEGKKREAMQNQIR